MVSIVDTIYEMTIRCRCHSLGISRLHSGTGHILVR